MTNDDYCRECIRTWVKSGWYTPEEVERRLEDIVEEDDVVDALRQFAQAEVRAQDALEAAWPSETDCDRIDRAFAAISSERIVALQNAGYTMSDGHSDVGEVLAPHPTGTFRGYCFYHGQDLERAVHTGQLYLAYADLRDTPQGKLAIGRVVVEAFRKQGFVCEWNEDVDKRILVTGIDWKRRRPRGRAE